MGRERRSAARDLLENPSRGLGRVRPVQRASHSAAAAAQIDGRDWVQKAGRLGWVAKGVVYVLMGMLALPIAGLGGAQGEASQDGAIAEIAGNPFGGVLLVAIALGLTLYAIWSLVSATLPGDNDAETWAKRAGFVLSGLVYLARAWTSRSFALAGGGSGDQSAVEKLSQSLLESTAGRWLLGIAGGVALGVAAYMAETAYAKKFLQRLDLSGAGRWERSATSKLGSIGWFGRAITVALIAFFVISAAWTADPDNAKGLDGALHEVSDNWWGSALVVVTAVGLLAYGCFAAFTARRRQLQGP
jgi:hypothetical protein